MPVERTTLPDETSFRSMRGSRLGSSRQLFGESLASRGAARLTTVALVHADFTPLASVFHDQSNAAASKRKFGSAA